MWDSQLIRFTRPPVVSSHKYHLGTTSRFFDNCTSLADSPQKFWRRRVNGLLYSSPIERFPKTKRPCVRCPYFVGTFWARCHLERANSNVYLSFDRVPTFIQCILSTVLIKVPVLTFRALELFNSTPLLTKASFQLEVGSNDNSLHCRLDCYWAVYTTNPCCPICLSSDLFLLSSFLFRNMSRLFLVFGSVGVMTASTSTAGSGHCLIRGHHHNCTSFFFLQLPSFSCTSPFSRRIRQYLTAIQQNWMHHTR